MDLLERATCKIVALVLVVFQFLGMPVIGGPLHVYHVLCVISMKSTVQLLDKTGVPPSCKQACKSSS